MREEEMTETKNSKIALLPSWQPHVISLHFPGYIVLIDCFLKFLFLVSCCFKFLTKFLLTFHSNTHISSSFLLVYVSNVVAPPVQRSFVRFRASPLLICCDYNLGLHKMEQLSPIPPKAMMKARRSTKRAILASLKWGEGWSRCSIYFVQDCSLETSALQRLFRRKAPTLPLTNKNEEPPYDGVRRGRFHEFALSQIEDVFYSVDHNTEKR